MLKAFQLWLQWRNRWGCQGARVPPETSDGEIFADLPGKKKAKKGKMKQKGTKIEKRRWKLENGGRKSFKMRRGPFH